MIITNLHKINFNITLLFTFAGATLYHERSLVMVIRSCEEINCTGVKLKYILKAGIVGLI